MNLCSVQQPKKKQLWAGSWSRPDVCFVQTSPQIHCLGVQNYRVGRLVWRQPHSHPVPHAWLAPALCQQDEPTQGSPAAFTWCHISLATGALSTAMAIDTLLCKLGNYFHPALTALKICLLCKEWKQWWIAFYLAADIVSNSQLERPSWGERAAVPFQKPYWKGNSSIKGNAAARRFCREMLQCVWGSSCNSQFPVPNQRW